MQPSQKSWQLLVGKKRYMLAHLSLLPKDLLELTVNDSWMDLS